MASKGGLCIDCGKGIAPILLALGSLTCHDCRRPSADVMRPRPA
jgi:hypothetical protein